jgi:hypothetical protein
MTRLKIPRKSKYVLSDLQVASFIYLQTRLKSSSYPLLKPKISPGKNPMPADKGNPEAAIVEECVANCDAVSLRVCNAWVVAFANANLAPFSI